MLKLFNNLGFGTMVVQTSKSNIDMKFYTTIFEYNNMNYKFWCSNVKLHVRLINILLLVLFK